MYFLVLQSFERNVNNQRIIFIYTYCEYAVTVYPATVEIFFSTFAKHFNYSKVSHRTETLVKLDSYTLSAAFESDQLLAYRNNSVKRWVLAFGVIAQLQMLK